MERTSMTVADQDLINKAEKLHWSEGDIADGFIDLAVSQEAKRILRGIRNHLYHREEAACGNI